MIIFSFSHQWGFHIHGQKSTAGKRESRDNLWCYHNHKLPMVIQFLKQFMGWGRPSEFEWDEYKCLFIPSVSLCESICLFYLNCLCGLTDWWGFHQQTKQKSQHAAWFLENHLCWSTGDEHEHIRINCTTFVSLDNRVRISVRTKVHFCVCEVYRHLCKTHEYTL